MSTPPSRPLQRTFGDKSNVVAEIGALFSPTSPFVQLLSETCLAEVQADAHLPRETLAIRQRLTDGLCDKTGVSVSFGERGHSLDELIADLRAVVAATPRTTGPKFFNQLFAGLEPSAIAGDFIATTLNISMFTFKCAGPQILIEKAVIARMALKVGYDPEESDGSFSPGGSMGNLTALTVARNEAFETVSTAGMTAIRARMYASAAAHYSLPKAAMLLGLGRANFVSIPTNDAGQMDVDALRSAIAEDVKAGWTPVAVIATAGTTVLGAFDDIAAIADVCAEHRVWLHVDAAAGGSLLLSPLHREKLAGIERSDSVAWCPCKLMGVPLVGSVILFRTKRLTVKHLNEVASTYLFQVKSDDMDDVNPGRSTLQCTRRNDAMKVWAAWRHLGDEGYAARVETQLATVQQLADRIRANPHCTLLTEPQSITLCFATPGVSPSAVCDALDADHCIKVGHAVEKGTPIMRVSLPNPDVPLTAIDDLFDKMFDKIAALKVKA